MRYDNGDNVRVYYKKHKKKKKMLENVFYTEHRAMLYTI